jgi:hypothetical protein
MIAENRTPIIGDRLNSGIKNVRPLAEQPAFIERMWLDY